MNNAAVTPAYSAARKAALKARAAKATKADRTLWELGVLDLRNDAERQADARDNAAWCYRAARDALRLGGEYAADMASVRASFYSWTAACEPAVKAKAEASFEALFV